MKVGPTVLVYWLVQSSTVHAFAPSHFKNGRRQGLDYRTVDHSQPMGNYMNKESFSGSFSDGDPGLVIDVQASNVDSEGYADSTTDATAHHNGPSNIPNPTEPRVVEAEFIDLNMHKPESNLRAIAEKEGYDTTGMGREELEKIARWVQSQKFQREKEEANRDKTAKTKYSAVPLEELQAVALNEGYDPRDMGRLQLEEIMEWVHSQKYHESKHTSHKQPSHESPYSSVPTEELQAVAIAEGYDVNGVGRDDLEKIAKWVHSQEYKQQKQHSETKAAADSKYASMSMQDLRKLAQKEGYDITGLDRSGLEKIAEWVNSEEYTREKQQSQSDKKESVSSRFASTNIADLRAIADNEGYDTASLGRKDLEKIAEWVHSQKYKEQKANSEIHTNTGSSVFAATSTADLQNLARAEGYDIIGVERKDLEKIAEWVQSDEYRQQKEHSQGKAGASTKFGTTSLENLKAIAQTEGYDIMGLDRSHLENIAEWVTTKKERESQTQPVSYGAQTLQTPQSPSQNPTKTMEELQHMAQEKGYDTEGLDRSDLEKIAEWIRTMPHEKPTGRSNVYTAPHSGPSGDPFKSDGDMLSQSVTGQRQPVANNAHNNYQQHVQQQPNPQHVQQQPNPQHHHQPSEQPFFANEVKSSPQQVHEQHEQLQKPRNPQHRYQEHPLQTPQQQAYAQHSHWQPQVQQNFVQQNQHSHVPPQHQQQFQQPNQQGFHTSGRHVHVEVVEDGRFNTNGQNYAGQEESSFFANEIYANPQQMHYHQEQLRSPQYHQQQQGIPNPNSYHDPNNPFRPQPRRVQTYAQPQPQPQPQAQTRQRNNHESHHHFHEHAPKTFRGNGFEHIHKKTSQQQNGTNGFHEAPGTRPISSFQSSRIPNEEFKSDREIAKEQLQKPRHVYNGAQSIQCDMPISATNPQHMETRTVSTKSTRVGTRRGVDIGKQFNKLRNDYEQRFVDVGGPSDPKVVASHFGSMQGVWKI